MSGAPVSPRGLEEPFQNAFKRLRLEGIARGADLLLWIVPAFFFLGSATAWILRLGWNVAVPCLLLGAAVWAGTWAALWFRPPGRNRLAEKMDFQARLPDQALAAAESSSEGSPWSELQRRQAGSAYAGKDWKRLWPVPLPRWFWIRMLAMVLGAAVFLAPGYFQILEERALAGHAERGASPRLQQDLQAVKEMLDEWEKNGLGRQDELQARLIKEAQPLRERLARGEMTERELLIELSRVEESLRAMQESLKSDSLQPFADPLAKAFEPHEGMGALAAALRRDSYDQAREEAERAAQKLDENGMRMDPGRAKELAEELERLAEEAREMSRQERPGGQGQPLRPSGDSPSREMASGDARQEGASPRRDGQQQNASNQQALSQALRQMASGMRQGNGRQAASGMREMAAALGREGGRQQQSGVMGGQMAQLGAGRQCMSQGEGFGQGAGRPGSEGEGQGNEGAGGGRGQSPSEQMARNGSGAGSAADEQPFGAATESGGHARREEVRGEAGSGESRVQVQRTLEPTFETVASGLEGARFQHYEKLSREAVGNEALPVSHRQSIRDYFERIRPKDNPNPTETGPAGETTP